MSIDLYPALDAGEIDVAVALERDATVGRVAALGAASLFYRNDEVRWPDEIGNDLSSRFPAIEYANFAMDGATIDNLLVLFPTDLSANVAILDFIAAPCARCTPIRAFLSVDFVSSDYLVGGHFTRIQVQSQTPEHGLTLNSDSYLLAGQMFAAPRSLQSQKLTWASGAFEYETVHSSNSTSVRNETKPV